MSARDPRESRWSFLRCAAALTRGPADLLDFVVPLWAGLALGLDATAIGLLVALELVVSCAARPLAGWAADRADRRVVAAFGAVIYGLGVAGYALATDGVVAVAFAAAVVSGVGGSVLWVALRAMVSEQYVSDATAFASLVSAEETGAWIAFVAGLSALGAVGYTGLFLLSALACLAGAVLVALLPAERSRQERSPGPARGLVRRLAPLLGAVVGSTAAEAGIGIVLLIHLQKHFELGVIEAAWVFLPGAIALAVLPKPLHVVVVRIGRRRALLIAAGLSCAFAVGLAFAPTPTVIGILWVLSAVAWAIVMPVEQAVVAESTGRSRFGAAMGAYEAAALAGGAVGTALAGIAYEVGSWQIACVVLAAIALLGGLAAPWALRAMDAADRPAPMVAEAGEAS